jgi:hypothetical protein
MRSRSDLEVCLVIWAAGFGSERSTLPTATGGVYRGQPFWGTDRLTKRSCGLRQPPRVVIVGAGDGGLQDFLRALTKRKSAREIFVACGVPAGIKREIHSAEERAHRLLLWSATRRHDHIAQTALQDAHVAAARQALADSGVRQSLRVLLGPAPEDVRLVYQCSHFSNTYALNRFLVLLIAEFLAQEHGRSDVLMSGRRADHVRAVDGHECAAEPSGCDGHEHHLVLGSAPQCWRDEDCGTTEMIPSEVIVIRSGLDLSGMRPKLPHAVAMHTQLARPRHSLPYHVPVL